MTTVKGKITDLSLRWKKHFPVDLGVSGEAAPLLVDLDRDGGDEIILPTADGHLRIIKWEDHGLRMLRVPLDLGPAIDPSGGIPFAKQTGWLARYWQS